MDRRAEACGASFLPSLPSFQFLSSAFRTDSLVLAICAPLAGLIDVETRLRRKGRRGNPKRKRTQELKNQECRDADLDARLLVILEFLTAVLDQSMVIKDREVVLVVSGQRSYS